jgi:hypothetical protein
MGTTIKYLRRSRSGCAGSSLATTTKYLQQRTSGAAGKRPGHHDQELQRASPFMK